VGVSGCERVSAPGSESIALGHALVCPGVSLGGDQLGGLPAWGPLGLNLLSGCRVCAQSYQQRSVSAQERHTHTRVHKRYICRTVAHWRCSTPKLMRSHCACMPSACLRSVLPLPESIRSRANPIACRRALLKLMNSITHVGKNVTRRLARRRRPGGADPHAIPVELIFI